MGIFQCAACGCAENTSSTNCYHARTLIPPEVLRSYWPVLGFEWQPENQPLCAACSPIWFANRQYGLGAPPDPATADTNREYRYRTWHAGEQRFFYPKGRMVTNQESNLVHRETGELAYLWARRTGWDTTKEDRVWEC